MIAAAAVPVWQFLVFAAVFVVLVIGAANITARRIERDEKREAERGAAWRVECETEDELERRN